MAKHFICCRGGGQTFNTGQLDLNYLAAYFLEKSQNNFDEVRDIIDYNRQAKGWLIFGTHDVVDQPSPFGCSPGFFEAVVDYAKRPPTQILTVAMAYEHITASSTDRN
jgi:hypothetical protein